MHMGNKKPKTSAAVQTVARPAHTRKARAAQSVPARRKRKVLDDQSLFGALPGMGKWAFPLLKELRDK